MKKGFTLLEMLAVIIILAMLSLTVFSLVQNQLQSQKGKLSDATVKLIENAADIYVTERPNTYPKESGNFYCNVTLKTLVDSGLLKSPIKDFESGEELDLNKIVKVTVNGNEYNYEIITAGGCK